MVRQAVALVLLATLASTALYYWLRDTSDSLPQPGPRDPSTSAHRHEWKRPGSHGGIIVKIAPNLYHAEAVFDKEGNVKLYMLGKNFRQLHDIEAQTLDATVQAEGEDIAVPLVLTPVAQPGDAAGKVSLFAGSLPRSHRERRIKVSVPVLAIDGQRFAVQFGNEVREDTPEVAMPSPATDEEEKQLYLEPGGAYTAADIAANGKLTASQRYRTFKAKHEDGRPGDRLCPVTKTKGNPACWWIVGGKKYEFCCPPCIDEFVRLAKSTPAAIKTPEEYVQK